MFIIELLLLASFLVMPLLSWIDGDKTKLAILNGNKSKVRSYKETIVYLWTPTVLLFVYLAISPLQLSDIGIHLNVGIKEIMFLLVLFAVAVFLYVSVARTRNDETAKAHVREQYSEFRWLMPENKKQLNWFVYGVSSSAGICEELLFRGFLLYYLGEATNLYVATIVSSLLFGLCHIYQGKSNVIRTALMGLVLAGVYISSGSLLVAIVLHVIIDAYAGALSYTAYKGWRPQPA